MSLNVITRDIDPFWFNEPKILIDKDRLTEFFPVNTMTNNEKLNSLVRLALYSTMILILYHKNLNVLMIPLFIGLVTLYVYKFNTIKDEKQEIFEESVCTSPTDDNPFMNTLLTDVSQYKEKPEACISTEKVKEDIHDKFHKDLFKDVNDLYDKNNGQNRFFTMPNTNEYGIKNGDSVKFANWLYNTGEPTCKEDTQNCTNSFTYYDNDLRNQPHLIIE
jgi:hypothetical protein